MSKTTPSTPALSFERLVAVIGQAHADLAAQASRAVNASLTLRNWLIGFHIEQYERRGVDRQQYGEKLLDRLSESLIQQGMSRCDRRELYRYRQFYLTYPRIVEALPPRFTSQLDGTTPRPRGGDRIVESPTPQSGIDAQALLACLSFTHFAELIAVEDDTKRAFYEAECLRGNWSVRELKRQVASLYYERSGLSTDKKRLSALAQTGVETEGPGLTIRDPYVFEFLGLKPQEVMGESHLED